MAIKIRAVLEKIANKQTVELTKQASESAKAVFGLAKTIKDKPLDGELLKTVQPYVGQFSSLLDILNSPLGLIVKEAIPGGLILMTLLNLFCEVTRKNPTLEECMALVVQAAYLDSLRLYLKEYETSLPQIEEAEVSESVSRQIRELGELEIGDRDARKAILFFHESEIAKAFTAVLEARLLEARVPVSSVRSIAEQVSRTTNYHIQTALAGMGDKINPVVKWFSSGGQEKFEQYLSIEEYLRDVISPDSIKVVLRNRWKVFNEPFTLKEIYVPTEARFINKEGEQEGDPVVLEQWAKAWLNRPEQEPSKVLFIQGHPGRGKSVFCRMFAEWVRLEQHPNWTPILIRLRDIQSLEKGFEVMLREAVGWNFALSDAGWLSDRNTRFLFLLDGFDELLMQGSRGLEGFLEQVEQFQHRCQENSEKGHRVLITGRTLALQSVEQRMPTNFERLEIIEMSNELQGCWFAKWVQLVGSEKTNAFQQFLQSKQCPGRVRELSREPLLLYLLAAMHRDGDLTLSAFEGAEGTQAKILIYEKTIDWVLTKQRPDILNRKLTELEIKDLRAILMEAGLSAVQAGGKCAPISMIEARLKSNANIQRMLEEARQRINEDPLRNALAAFYLQPGSQNGSVEFIHKSFGEFLCAERLKEAIESWTKAGKNRRDFYVRSEQLHQEIYDLMGAPVLTAEIVEYLMALLSQSDRFQPVKLFERLNEFYELWCEGKFIDALPDENFIDTTPDKNLPQKKMRLLREQLPAQDEPLGIRQVDVYAGLNVMILLLELHRYAQARAELKEKIDFHPDRILEEEGSRDRLQKVISYSDCLKWERFTTVVGTFLTHSNLANINLFSANLAIANLSNANLSNANLFSANLASVNLSNANLSNANLFSTNFTGANLSNANLFNASLFSANFANANLSNANLSNANLFGVNFAGANLSNANFTRTELGNIIWDSQTNWEKVQGLEKAFNVPIALKQQLGLE